MTQIALSTVLESAIALMRSGRWDDATQLLEAVAPTDPAETVALAATRAEVAVDQDFAQVQDTAGPLLELFEKALTESPDDTLSWDLDMLKLRKTYGSALVAGGTGDRGTELGKQADALQAAAPDDSRAGHAAFYAGVIADNLRERPDQAFAYYKTAFELGERSGDKMVISLALRHLGDHAHTAGDLKLARAHWERSTELRQQIGHLLGALAQQTLLAVLTREEGNPVAAAAIATEVNRWSRQVNLPWLVTQSANLIPDPAA
jgi:tetratricopeptide (TPR) repeat protein